MSKLSYTLESYLDAVYELSENGEGVRLTDIAARMRVNKSTANAAMVSLAERDLIANERYGQIKLTAPGLDAAKSVTQKHKTLFRFFTEILCLDAETADIDACAIEHVIGANAVSAMQKALDKKGSAFTDKK